MLVVLLAFVVFPSPHAHAKQVITVGVDPSIYAIVVDGVAGWNLTANVQFDVQDTGCGTGDLTFCIVPHDGDLGWVAWYTIGGNVIDVDSADVDYIDGGDICHEIGHYLGLQFFADGSIYHRHDYTSCMSDPGPRPPYPDDTDLQNLGFTWAAQTSTHSATVGGVLVTELPQTGTGSIDKKGD